MNNPDMRATHKTEPERADSATKDDTGMGTVGGGMTMIQLDVLRDHLRLAEKMLIKGMNSNNLFNMVECFNSAHGYLIEARILCGDDVASKDEPVRGAGGML